MDKKTETKSKKNIAITVDNLHITYRGLKKTSIRASWKNFGDKIETYEALKGVSFEVEEGKILGIIGQNGAGKSTMLKAIDWIFSPDEGSIDLHGKTISLLSIGVGFNKKLTGKENIYLSGMLLGFTEEQIKEKEKDIINFADIGEFINKPVKTYSSGMYSKLAFAITAILETDITLIDEVLSVGDAKFQEKSYNKMKEEKLKAKLLLQIHDELLIEAPLDEKEKVKEILKTQMESAAKLSVPLIAEVSEAVNWYECK